MARTTIKQADLIRLAKIARMESICVEISRGDTTIKLYPLSTKDAETAELDRELEEFDRHHGYLTPVKSPKGGGTA
jgi:hypothetical protein